MVDDPPTKENPVEGADYYIDKDTGFLVFTGKYLLKRGYCCNNKCRHCPYKTKSQDKLDI